MGEPPLAGVSDDPATVSLHRRIQELTAEIAAVRRESDELRTENGRLAKLLGLDPPASSEAHRQAWTPEILPEEHALPAVTTASTPEEKIRLFRMLFAGRDDVFATRWENASTGKSGWSPAVRGGWGGRRRANADYLPLTDEVLGAHLTGRRTVGIYPLLPGDVCQLLACDFDGQGWTLDALAYIEACRAAGVPAALERSRSGNGAHVWLFFTAPVPAATARTIGAALIRETMAARVELDLDSYDRLFPAQDFLPKAGFGNLIALPLHGGRRREGATEFLDPATLKPWEDQWAFLSSVARLTPGAARSIAEGLRPVEVGPAAARLRRSRRAESPPPESIRATLGAAVSIARIGLPPSLVASLKHQASLQNPEYYEKERLRFSTFRTPRFVRCYWEDLEHLHLPRGLLPQVESVVQQAGSRLAITDARPNPQPCGLAFRGALSEQQARAVDDLAAHVCSPDESGH
ncbi:MAG: TOTE conflict system archaeo-eukaryotic primase domain-containing protein [Acidimicrobiales bacterium]